MNFWVDTHCHLNHPDFAADWQQVWQRARAAGVRYAIVVGYDVASSRLALQVAEQLDGCFAAIGIHPHDARQCNADTLAQLRQLAQHPRLVAIGEIGLDYYRDLSPRDIQLRAFHEQLGLATELGLPVIIHCREAYDDLLNVLSSYSLRGVLHCFSGTPHHARQAVQMGWYLGIGGVVTFRNAHLLREVVQQTPLSHLLLETDAPYLAPVPHRGKRNEPAYLPLVAQAIASTAGVSPEEVSTITTRNASHLFGGGTVGFLSSLSV